MKKRGFTLIELIILVAVIAIIAAIAIPNLLRSRMEANEAQAAEAMRTITKGEVAFQYGCFSDADKDGVGDYGSLAELANPGEDVPPFIDTVLGGGNKQGYSFTVTVISGSSKVLPGYTCTAVPSAPGRTGTRQYFVDESGVIRFTADGSAVTAKSPPLN